MIEEVSYDKIFDLLFEYKKDYIVNKNNYTKYISYKLDKEYISFLCYSNILGTIEIIDAFTLEKYRRKNIMTKLFDYILENEKADEILLEVNVNNIAALNLYKKNGFVIISIRKGYYKGIDAYLMKKEMK